MSEFDNLCDKQEWLHNLNITRLTLTRLRANIGGDSPSQKKMDERLRLAAEIVQAMETIERELMP